jgi:hypothetical protein
MVGELDIPKKYYLAIIVVLQRSQGPFPTFLSYVQTCVRSPSSVCFLLESTH